MNDYTIYCTPEQARRALELNAPIKVTFLDIPNKFEYEGCPLEIPTSEQMINWLEGQGIKCFVLPDMYDDDSYNIQINKNLITTGHSQYDYPLSYNSRKEATINVINMALEYLSQNK